MKNKIIVMGLIFTMCGTMLIGCGSQATTNSEAAEATVEKQENVTSDSSVTTTADAGESSDSEAAEETTEKSDGKSIFNADQLALINALNEMSSINGVPVNEVASMSAEDVAALLGLTWEKIADTDIMADSCPYQGSATSADGSIIISRICLYIGDISEATMSNPYVDIQNDYDATLSYMADGISWFTINLDGYGSGAQLDLRYAPKDKLGAYANESIANIESKTFSENVFYSRFNIEGDDTGMKFMPKVNMPDGIDSVMIMADDTSLTINTNYSNGTSYYATISDYGGYLVVDYR